MRVDSVLSQVSRLEGLRNIDVDKGKYSCWHKALLLMTRLGGSCSGTLSENTRYLISFLLVTCNLHEAGHINHDTISDFGIFDTYRDHRLSDKALDLSTFDHCEDVLLVIHGLVEGRITYDNGTFSQGYLDFTVDDLQRVLDTDFFACLWGHGEMFQRMIILYYNHIDNVCFFYHTQMWQSSTDLSLNDLLGTSGAMRDQVITFRKELDKMEGEMKSLTELASKDLDEAQEMFASLTAKGQEIANDFTAWRDRIKKEEEEIVPMLETIAQFFHLDWVLNKWKAFMKVLEPYFFFLKYQVVAYVLTWPKATRPFRYHFLWVGLFVYAGELLMAAPEWLLRMFPHLRFLRSAISSAFFWTMGKAEQWSPAVKQSVFLTDDHVHVDKLRLVWRHGALYTFAAWIVYRVFLGEDKLRRKMTRIEHTLADMKSGIDLMHNDLVAAQEAEEEELEDLYDGVQLMSTWIARVREAFNLADTRSAGGEESSDSEFELDADDSPTLATTRSRRSTTRRFADLSETDYGAQIVPRRNPARRCRPKFPEASDSHTGHPILTFETPQMFADLVVQGRW
eukprot:GHVU01004723.1.p1 GENE.GHVU01004723.1~~GHVU01004723.1.p1  ORF type:complete len:566 (+),score=72.89 GHVU01004723.1:774-2471(+)